MHLRFALDPWNADLWDMDLLDTDLDLLVGHGLMPIPSKHFVYLQDVLKTCL